VSQFLEDRGILSPFNPEAEMFVLMGIRVENIDTPVSDRVAEVETILQKLEESRKAVLADAEKTRQDILKAAREMADEPNLFYHS